MTTADRIAEIEADLTAVRAQIRTALEAVSTTVDGRGLVQQSLMQLQDRERRLEWALNLARRGSSWGQRTVLPPPPGVYRRASVPASPAATPDPTPPAVASGHGYTYWARWDQTTTPAFAANLADLTLPIEVPQDEYFTTTVLDTVIEMLQPGQPLTLDYAGGIAVSASIFGNYEIDIGYRLWPGDARQATFWREHLATGLSNSVVSAPGDIYSHTSVLDIGTPLPTDDGGVHVVTADDFAAGFPVQILLRVGAHLTFSVSADLIAFTLTRLEWHQPQLVASQLPIQGAS